MIVEVRQGDVTGSDADLIVNASNTAAWLGSGVSGAIRRACGPGFQEAIGAALKARFVAGEMEPGDVLITDAGAHPRAKYVAHVAVMDYREGRGADARPDAARIEKCCRSLWAAIELFAEPVSVAMVALGAGTGGLGVRIPTEMTCRTLKEVSPPKIERVIFFGWETHEYANILHVVRKYFDVDERSIPADVLSFVNSIDD